jgi:uncharacterized protein YqiB (DUF1249 family)
MDIHEQIFSLFDQLFQGKLCQWLQMCQPGQALQSEHPPFMNLHLDVLDRQGTKTVTIALAHNYRQHGDVVPDPDMQIRFFLPQRRAEALTFQDAYGYRQVYFGEKVDLAAKRELNAFLRLWLRNCLKQQHQFII